MKLFGSSKGRKMQLQEPSENTNLIQPRSLDLDTALRAESFKSELAKISELRNRRIKNSKNGLLKNLFDF